MKTLAFVAVIFGYATFASPPYLDPVAEAQAGAIPLPDSSCRWITDYAVRCTDQFGYEYTCNLRSYEAFRRWECA